MTSILVCFAAQTWNPATTSAALTAAQKAASGLDDWNDKDMESQVPLVYDMVHRRVAPFNCSAVIHRAV
jgi:hypothetical protein